MMKRCAHCGSTMRIESTGDTRMWVCVNHRALTRTGCLKGIEPIPDDHEFPVGDIAEGLAGGFFTSTDERKREQAAIKRTRSTLVTQRDRFRAYLSGDERATIDNAVRLLDKLVAAAERSSKIKERMEKEQEARRAQRAETARQEWERRYPSLPRNEKIRIGLALRQALGEGDAWTIASHDALTLDRLRADMRDHDTFWDLGGEHAEAKITRIIERRYRAQVDALVEEVKWDVRPVEELVDGICAAVERYLSAQRQEVDAFAGELTVWLVQRRLVEASPPA